MNPTPEQLKALRAYAERKGEFWKQALILDWMNGRDVTAIPEGGCYLRQLRNQFGPSWLETFEL